MKNKEEKPVCELLEIFSSNMEYYRKVSGFSQLELARLSGYAHNFINDIENRKKGASFETVENIARALNIEPFFLFINPKDRYYGENHKLIGYLTVFNKNINTFLEKIIKELSGDKEKPKKKATATH